MMTSLHVTQEGIYDIINVWSKIIEQRLGVHENQTFSTDCQDEI